MEAMLIIKVLKKFTISCTVNTKAEVRFHLDSADWIPLRVKERVKAMVRAYLLYLRISCIFNVS